MAEVKQNMEIEFESGKKVVLRDFKIRDLQIGAQAASKRGGDNQFSFSICLQQEMLKMLLVSVDGKILTAMELEQIDNFLEPGEYMALSGVIQELLGNAPIKGKAFVPTSGNK